MSSIIYDLAVAYRIYPKVSKNPPVFSDDKLKLSEFCLNSFKKSLGGLKPKMYVILDGCPSEYESIFRKYFEESDLFFLKVDEIGNYKTFELQIDTLLNQSESEIIYFAEDDYYYLPNQFEDMINFIRNNPKAHFISPYDHLDYYCMDLHDDKYYITFSSKKHWRTTVSTCLTFLTTKRNLLQTKDVFLSFVNGNYDASLWMILTKYKVFNLIRLLKSYKNSHLEFSLVISAWKYGWRYLLFKKKYFLWVPIPSIATHMEKYYLAPTMETSLITDYEFFLSSS
jgi:hypothetical protein